MTLLRANIAVVLPSFAEWERGSLASAATLALDDRSALRISHSSCKVRLKVHALERLLLLLRASDTCVVDPTPAAALLERPATSVVRGGLTRSVAAFPVVETDSARAWHRGWPQSARPLAHPLGQQSVLRARISSYLLTDNRV